MTPEMEMKHATTKAMMDEGESDHGCSSARRGTNGSLLRSTSGILSTSAKIF